MDLSFERGSYGVGIERTERLVVRRGVLGSYGSMRVRGAKWECEQVGKCGCDC